MRGEESEVSKGEILEYLSNRIKQLKKELSILEALMNELQGAVSKEVEERAGKEPSSVKVISFKGKVLADIVETEDGIKVILTESIPTSSSVVKSFLLKLLDDKVQSSEINSYEIIERRGYITGIEVKGKPSKRFLKDLELALTYVWSEVSK